MRRILIGAAALLAVSMPASAQVPSGWYGGFTAGILTGTHEDEFGLDLPHSGFSIGTFAGYRENLGLVIVGGELGADANVNHSADAPALGLPEAHAGVAARFSIRGLVGLPVDRFTPYLAAGPVVGWQQYSPRPGVAADVLHWGGELAAGADFRLTNALFLRGEARLTMFSRETYDIGLGGFEAGTQNTFDVRVGAGLTY